MAKPKNVAVILSGCGVMDGSEIHEATLTLLFLDRLGAQAVCAAPDIAQADVVDHARNRPAGATRNVLSESARIARGAIRDLRSLHGAEVDAVILPGGFGAAKNLCTFAQGGADWEVNPDVERLLNELHAAKKPIGAMCIAPAILAKVFGDRQVRLTIGSDPATAKRLTGRGAIHENCAVDEVVHDETLRIVTTPAYMLAQGIGQAAAGIEKLCRAVVEMA